MVKGLGDGIREFKKGIGDDPDQAKPSPKQADAKVNGEAPADRKKDA
jgi:Sec-independent protein translocase protein TatA